MKPIHAIIVMVLLLGTTICASLHNYDCAYSYCQ